MECYSYREEITTDETLDCLVLYWKEERRLYYNIIGRTLGSFWILIEL